MRKRKEGDILRAVLEYLQILENNGRIIWVDRINSGTIFIPKPYPRKIRLCREGTPDAYFVTNDYVYCWIETKLGDAELRPEQKQFQAKFNKPPKSYYFVIRSLDDLVREIEDIAK